MIDNTTVAHPYAKALFELSKSTNTVEKWQGDLSVLAMVAEDKNFAALIDNPKITQVQLVEILTSFLPKVDVQVKNLLNLLRANGRLSALSNIYVLFDQMVKEDKKIATATIYSAYAMNDVDKAQVESLLGKKLGYKISANVVVDSDLIGGIKVLINDTVIDASIQGRLSKMATQII